MFHFRHFVEHKYLKWSGVTPLLPKFGRSLFFAEEQFVLYHCLANFRENSYSDEKKDLYGHTLLIMHKILPHVYHF